MASTVTDEEPSDQPRCSGGRWRVAVAVLVTEPVSTSAWVTV